MLSTYLEIADSNKNATYLPTNTVTQFLNVISDWMKDETLSIVKKCDFTTIMLDESTDESNQSEMSLTVHILRNSMIENHFLDLVHLRRCDAETIFSEVETYLRENDLDFKKIKFASMNGSSSMAGDHNSVKVYSDKSTLHFLFIHCRNHCLVLCFAHLIPKFDEFKGFNSHLLNLYLLLKNSSIKQSIFEEVQAAYGLQSLKLIKTAVTRWLSHGKAVKQVLDMKV